MAVVLRHLLPFALGLSAAVWADPSLRVDVRKAADKVEIRLTGSAPVQPASQRWKENPHRFEVAIPGVDGKPVSSALDLGVLQKVEARSLASGVSLQLFASGNPKMSWTASADRKVWTLTVSPNEMAASADPPRLPAAGATSAKPPARPARPAAATPRPRVAEVPPVVTPPVPDPPPVSPTQHTIQPPPTTLPPAAPVTVTAVPAAARPTPASTAPVTVVPSPAAPVPVTPSPVARPAATPVVTRPPLPATVSPTPQTVSAAPVTPPVVPPAPARPDAVPVTLSLKNRPAAEALADMARAAGLVPDIGPGLEGNVTVDLQAAPLSQAVTRVLGKQSRLYEYSVQNGKLRVWSDEADAGVTLVPDAVPAVARLSDYYPIMADKPASDVADSVRRAVSGVEVLPDDRLNVLFVRGSAAELDQVRTLLRNVLAR